MKEIAKICEKVEKCYKFFFYLSGAFLGALVILTFFIVMARLFNFSPKWGDELQRYLMIGMVFSAIPYMANAKTFLVVDLTAIFFGKKKEFNRSMILIGEVIFLVFVIYLIFPCMELTLKNVQLLTPALRWRKAAVYSFMPISFVFAAIAEIKNLLKFFLVDKVVKKAGEAH